MHRFTMSIIFNSSCVAHHWHTLGLYECVSCVVYSVVAYSPAHEVAKREIMYYACIKSD